jgi:exonuclease SbcC
MRPLSLELEGFTSFRERVTVDFTDADLFVLSGPMGAGKSSIIDALGFALYGSIARFQNKALIAPVISQGLQEAKVQLDFRLGEAQYTAVRVVRKNRAGGASQPEARLNAGSKLLAEDADSVTREVEKLLGLSFDQFTKCVVLPQGEFADLLHARPAERQELLVRLLDIGLYRKIGERARGRVARGEGILSQLKHHLENDLRNVSQEAWEAQDKRVKALAALIENLEAQDAELQTLAQTAEAHRAAAAKAGEVLTLLEAVRLPPGVNDLVSKLESALKTAAAALKREQEVAVQIEALEQQKADLPDPAALELVIKAHQERKAIADRIAAAEKTLKQAETALEAGEKDAAAAQEATDAAIAEYDRLVRADSAYHASQGLKAGDICPVCGEVLAETPSLTPPAGVDKAEAAVTAARRTLHEIEAQNTRTREGIAGLRNSVQQETQRLEGIAAQLEGQPAAPEAAALLTKVRKAEGELTSSRQLERNIRLAHQRAQEALTAVQREEQLAWTRLHSVRAQVVAAGAPEPEGTLSESWKQLVGWAHAAAGEQRAQQTEAQSRELALREQERALRQQQAALCAEAGVPVAGRPAREAALQAHAAAERELQHIDERLTERLSVERDLDVATKTTATARLLGTHLSASRFERWYLQEAMARLVHGASEKMLDLTNRQYSLAVNRTGNDFVVIDHVNANEERPVRTLSGGETFLASLSLALALGEDIASLAARGASRLDALFLDEGFGSLDPNTLETVASTIEELGARGRMVGIVTHVQELADRIPTQFRVSKVNGTSMVERVEQ